MDLFIYLLANLMDPVIELSQVFLDGLCHSVPFGLTRDIARRLKNKYLDIFIIVWPQLLNAFLIQVVLTFDDGLVLSVHDVRITVGDDRDKEVQAKNDLNEYKEHVDGPN